MGKTYNVTARTNEISLGVERLLIAAYPTTFSAARVDAGTPPAGFFDMGNVVEDTPTFRFGREMFKLELGVPRSLQYEKVIAVSGSIEFSLHSHSYYQAQFMLGNATSITTATTQASGSIVTQYLGTSVLQEYALLGVADFIDGTQLIHEFPRVSPAEEFVESIKPGENPRMVCKFNCKSVVVTIGGCQHLVVGKRHWVAPDGSC